MIIIAHVMESICCYPCNVPLKRAPEEGLMEENRPEEKTII